MVLIDFLNKTIRGGGQKTARGKIFFAPTGLNPEYALGIGQFCLPPPPKHFNGRCIKLNHEKLQFRIYLGALIKFGANLSRKTKDKFSFMWEKS